jgi:hypothetical protein
MLNLLGSRKTKMSGTTFLSNPCYLPIFENQRVGGLERYTEIWINFVKAGSGVVFLDRHKEAHDRINEYNGRVINDVVVFDTEQDKMWFILRWS